MKNEQKIAPSKRVVLIAWIVAIVGAASLNYIEIFRSQSSNAFDIPNWCIALFFFGSILMCFGALLATRGVGIPLNAERLFAVLLRPPCWILALIYITLIIFVPIFNRLIF